MRGVDRVRTSGWTLAAIVVAVALRLLLGGHAPAPAGPSAAGPPSPGAGLRAQAGSAASPAAPARSRPAVGFRSQARWREHYGRHGAEVGARSAQDYLARAQALRDAPLGGAVEELTRADGVTCRFDRSNGTFVAFGADGTLRTFFRPNDGEAYFRRQADRPADSP